MNGTQKKELIKYRCEPDFVEWAQGCGHEGERSPYNGGGKFPWKVEWAAKWPVIGPIYETAGKDHFTIGGSRSVAIAISTEIFDFPPPLPSTRKEIGDAYEFFTIGGKKMSTSKGRGVGFAEIADLVPPKILRYLLVKTRPRAVIDFDPYGTNKLVLLYDNYDHTERVYFGEDEVDNERELAQEKRIYELSHVGDLPKKLPPQVSLSHTSMLVQTCKTDEEIIEKLQKTGHVPKKVISYLTYLKERFDSARAFLENFADESYIFSNTRISSS